MLVHNKGDYVRKYQGIRLIPGVNKINDKDWVKFVSHPLNQQLVDDGEIVPQIAPDKQEREGGIKPRGLVDMNAGEVAALVKETFDLQLLDELEAEEKSGEYRKGVLTAIEKQRAEIQKSIEEARKKAEDGGDE
ncbi:MAG: hypothetical protein K0Q94_560 [Paenibacillus sp.]|jgi:hypothetical protein|nr:hypothetical protein [Paenibacillus sp.]